MHENNKHIDHLIARYIAGEASVVEKQELTRWMEQNETNRKYFEGICFADQQAVASHKIEKVDAEKAWQKVHSKMKAGQRTIVVPEEKKKMMLPVWIRIAAIILLVSGLSLLIYNPKDSSRIKYGAIAASSPDSILTYALADSSVITLNHNSQIACASNYGQKERRVELTGEAFFSVKHNPEKPFIVEGSGTFVKVTGTSFNIKTNDPDSLVEVYVKTGRVLFFTTNNEGISLNAGEMGVYDKITGTFTKTEINYSNVTAYVNRVFVFHNTTLNEVFRQLKKVYGVTVVTESPQLGLCTITVSFNNDDIVTILDIIAETLNLKYVSEGNNHYAFTGQTCNANEKNP